MAFKFIIALVALATAQAGYIESNNGAAFGSPHLLLNSHDQHHHHHHQDVGYTGGDYHYNTYKVASANVPIQVTKKLYTDQLFSVNPHHPHQQQQHMHNNDGGHHVVQYPTHQYQHHQPSVLSSSPIHTTAIATAGVKHTKTIDYSTPIYKSIDDFSSHIPSLSPSQQVVHKNYENSYPTIQKSLEYTIPTTTTIQKTLQQYATSPAEVASIGQKSVYYAEPVTYAHKTTHHQQQQPQQYHHQHQHQHQMPLSNGHASYTTISAPKTYTSYAAPVFESHTANVATPVFQTHNNPHHHHHHQYETQENIHGDNIGVISHFEKSIISPAAVVPKTYSFPKYSLENYKISAIPSVTLQKYAPQQHQQSQYHHYNHESAAPVMHRYATTSPAIQHQYAPSSSSSSSSSLSSSADMMNKKYTIPTVQYKSATYEPSSSFVGHQHDQLTSGHQYAHSAPIVAHKAIHYSPSDVVAHATFESADAHYSW